MKATSIATVILAAAVCGACSREPRPQTVAETQPGSSADLEKGPEAGAAAADCRDLISTADLKKLLVRAPREGGEAGGLFSGTMEWGAIVNRKGELCTISVTTDDPAASWPGSIAIAKAKAFTANAFSTDTAPLSTARLYTLTQPGHSLWGAGAADPFNADCLATPDHADRGQGKVCGGAIVFGGGVPLYKNKTRVGGLGVSGDTACADHEIAKRIRHLAGLDPEKGEFVDDITYSGVDGASVFTHPLCVNTWRNGQKIGEEPKASGY